ncbi:MAG: hypothetical protein QF824_02175 [Candidatus Woesearchaeota archaeon]|jgi:hypothetical protein|nr:hypothetical protein [Candidatus Woesearchaeota archaeon]|tara:strand:- start:478 stop:804 length:327 start_codon:yes stop_codon:yes gene_type:complete
MYHEDRGPVYASQAEKLFNGEAKMPDGSWIKDGQIAIDVTQTGEGTYRVAAGVRVGHSFTQIGAFPDMAQPKGQGLGDIADKELEPFGKDATKFDVFLDGRLHRPATE